MTELTKLLQEGRINQKRQLTHTEKRLDAIHLNNLGKLIATFILLWKEGIHQLNTYMYGSTEVQPC